MKKFVRFVCMYKRGWLAEAYVLEDIPARTNQVRGFLGVNHPLEVDYSGGVYFDNEVDVLLSEDFAQETNLFDENQQVIVVLVPENGFLRFATLWADLYYDDNLIAVIKFVDDKPVFFETQVLEQITQVTRIHFLRAIDLNEVLKRWADAGYPRFWDPGQ